MSNASYVIDTTPGTSTMITYFLILQHPSLETTQFLHKYTDNDYLAIDKQLKKISTNIQIIYMLMFVITNDL